jgi:hypothetical protein
MASIPCLLRLSTIIIRDELRMVFIRTSLEPGSKLQAAYLFDSNIGSRVEILFGDVVLSQAHSLVSLPDGNIDALFLIVFEVVKPDNGISVGRMFVS